MARLRRQAACTPLLLLLLTLAACGNTRTPVPSVSSPAPPGSFRELRFPSAGVSLRVPVAWLVSPGRAPLLTTISSEAAIVAVWRFPRSAPVPSSHGALEGLLRRLIAQARARDPTFSVIRSRLVTFDGAPAIELDAFERIRGQQRRVRSTHVFERGAEVVLDEYAPAALFHAVDHAVFSPVKRSLALSASAA